MHTIREYIKVRRQTIAAYIVHRPIFELCVEERRRRGTSPHALWWNQAMDLELVREFGETDSVVADEGDV